MYYIPQITNHDCLLTATKIMLANYYDDEKFLYIKEDELKSSYSYFDSIQVFHRYNVDAKGFKCDRKEELLKLDKFPVILTLEIKKNIFHSVVIMKKSRNKFIILDPGKGVYKASIKTIMSIWAKTGIFINQEKEKATKPSKKKKPLNFLEKYFIPILSSFLLGGAIYFMNSAFPIYMSYIFLGLFIINELIYKFTLFKSLKKLDKMLNNISVNSDNYKLFYYRFENYKKNIIDNSTSIINTWITSLFLSFILTINNIVNIALIFIPLLFALIQRKSYLNKQIPLESELSYIENSLDVVTNKDDFLKITSTLHKKSYKLGKQILLKKLLSYLIFALLSILVCYLAKEISLSNIVFYFCIQTYLYSSYEHLFLAKQKSQSHLKSKALLLNLLNENSLNSFL